MTTPTQGAVRSWARGQGMKVNARGSLPTAVMQAYLSAHRTSGPVAPGPTAPSPAPAASESAGLAAGLHGFLAALDTEVQAVSSLSERIDAAVAGLNELRDEQAKRLLALDRLKAAAEDVNLSAFLAKRIKPRTTKVSELVPERLS
ncbi:MAG: hypothetical protein NVS3B26_14410 [Mycobacteriales bacterium]